MDNEQQTGQKRKFTPIPNPPDMETLEKVHATGRAAMTKRQKREVEERKGKKTSADQRVPIMREPPRHQQKGQIVKGPTTWVVCPACTKLFSTKTKPVRYGVRKRHAARHLADHRGGRIKRPTVPAAAEHRDFHRAKGK